MTYLMDQDIGQKTSFQHDILNQQRECYGGI